MTRELFGDHEVFVFSVKSISSYSKCLFYAVVFFSEKNGRNSKMILS